MIEIVRIFITAAPASDVMRPPSKAAEKAILCHGGCGFDTIV
jgi:hypothetical protein